MEDSMAKNKGGREVRKPKQVKKPKDANASPEPLRVASKPRPTR
jgi:hypothetical protein